MPNSSQQQLPLVRPSVMVMVRITNLLGLQCAWQLRTLPKGHCLYSQGQREQKCSVWAVFMVSISCILKVDCEYHGDISQ